MLKPMKKCSCLKKCGPVGKTNLNDGKKKGKTIQDYLSK